MTPEQVESTRAILLTARNAIRDALARAASFEQDHQNKDLVTFAKGLLKIAGRKRKRLERVLPADDANTKRWELFIAQARKALNPHDFKLAAEPYRKKLDDAWAAIQKQRTDNIAVFDKLADMALVKHLPYEDHRPWQKLATAKVGHREDVEKLAETMKSLGVRVDLSIETEPVSATEGKITGYTLLAAVEGDLDVELVHLFARRKAEADAAAKLTEKANANG